MSDPAVPHSRAPGDPAARTGGWALIVAAILFMAVFGYLAARFDYPDILDGSADAVLPRLVGLGLTGRAVWGLYALLPLLLLPAGLGAYAALRSHAPGTMRLAAACAGIAAGAMLLGLLRWPSAQWELGLAYVAATSDAERTAIGALFNAFNSYFGNFIGEFVGELALNLFFLCTALGMRRAPGFPRWSGPVGIAAALVGLVVMWRNVTPAVAWVSEIENLLLPLWMIGLGALLVRGERAE